MGKNTSFKLTENDLKEMVYASVRRIISEQNDTQQTGGTQDYPVLAPGPVPSVPYYDQETGFLNWDTNFTTRNANGELEFEPLGLKTMRENEKYITSFYRLFNTKYYPVIIGILTKFNKLLSNFKEEMFKWFEKEEEEEREQERMADMQAQEFQRQFPRMPVDNTYVYKNRKATPQRMERQAQRDMLNLFESSAPVEVIRYLTKKGFKFIRNVAPQVFWFLAYEHGEKMYTVLQKLKNGTGRKTISGLFSAFSTATEAMANVARITYTFPEILAVTDEMKYKIDNGDYDAVGIMASTGGPQMPNENSRFTLCELIRIFGTIGLSLAVPGVGALISIDAIREIIKIGSDEQRYKLKAMEAMAKYLDRCLPVLAKQFGVDVDAINAETFRKTAEKSIAMSKSQNIRRSVRPAMQNRTDTAPASTTMVKKPLLPQDGVKK